MKLQKKPAIPGVGIPRSSTLLYQVRRWATAMFLSPIMSSGVLWHLVLFQWNQGAGVSAELA